MAGEDFREVPQTLIKLLLFSGTYLFIRIGDMVILVKEGLLKRNTLLKLLDFTIKIGGEIQKAEI
jgi:hypothetical protein